MSDKRDKKKPITEPTVIGQASPLHLLNHAARPARLEQVRGPGAPNSFNLEYEETVIGRSGEADVTIASELISREHISFCKVGMQMRFVDLDSSNGVFLNGGKAHSAILHEGDSVQIGDVLFVFHEGG